LFDIHRFTKCNSGNSDLSDVTISHDGAGG
jgi:hypothetical protein